MDEGHPQDNNPQDPKDPKKNEEGEEKDFKKVQDKYEELKSHPNFKKTKGLFSNYFFEIFYLVAVVIAFILSLTRSGHGGLVFTGIGFLVGLFLYSLIHKTTHKVGRFLTKQEMVIHIVLAVVIILLAIFIPTIMMGILVGLPAGFGVRHWINEINDHMGSNQKPS